MTGSHSLLSTIYVFFCLFFRGKEAAACRVCVYSSDARALCKIFLKADGQAERWRYMRGTGIFSEAARGGDLFGHVE